MKKEYGKKMPYTVIRFGTKCNAKCLFCNVPPGSHNLPSEVSVKRIKDEIVKLTRGHSGVKISLSGGEPSIRNDLIEVIKFAKAKGVKTVEMQTNSIALSNKELAKRLKEAGLDRAFVSFHSHIPEIQDHLLGIKSAYHHCVEGIKNLINAGIVVTLNPVITAKNYKELPGYVIFIKKEFPKIRYISLSVVQPNNRAWENKHLIPRYGEIDLYVEKALDLGEKLKIFIFNPYCGLPLCIGRWWRFPKRCAEFSEKFFQKHQIDFVESNLFSVNEKIKAPQCLFCDVEKFCNGVWKNYSKLYPLSDLKPVYLAPKERKLYFYDRKKS